MCQLREKYRRKLTQPSKQSGLMGTCIGHNAGNTLGITVFISVSN